MASVLATLAALVVIGLLFALDPSGAIAESGFPDFRDMGWKQLAIWGFRTIGIGVALLLVLWLWLRYRPWRGIKHRDSLDLETRQRVMLPAAVVVDNPAAFGQVFNLCDMFVYNQELARLVREVTGGGAEIVQSTLVKSAAISSEQVKRLGVDVHQGMVGIRAYFEELRRLI